MKTKVAWVALWAGVFCAVADGSDNMLQAKPVAIEAWKDMRFGMFICWGPVTLTGKEIGWTRGKSTPIEEYDSLYQNGNSIFSIQRSHDQP